MRFLAFLLFAIGPIAALPPNPPLTTEQLHAKIDRLMTSIPEDLKADLVAVLSTLESKNKDAAPLWNKLSTERANAERDMVILGAWSYMSVIIVDQTARFLNRD